jgi:menaquinone-dependent protoporphyrinogen oxidase
LRRRGLEVETLPARRAGGARGFDAVVVGGALYANRWHASARRFVERRVADLRRVPVWLFSSGPLDESADRGATPPTVEVATLMDRIGAQAHVTFGGRLERTARGFPASAMAKKHAGDWRRPELVDAWAAEIAAALPSARPRPAVDHRGHALSRLFAYGVAGWAACAALMMGLLALTRAGTAVAVHAVAAPIIFALIAQRYFRVRGARAPFVVAGAFTAIIAALDLGLVAGIAQRSLAMPKSIVGFWLPLTLIFAVTWAIGVVRTMTVRPDRLAA